MYESPSFLILSHSISLSTFNLRHKTGQHGSPHFFLFILSLLYILAGYPALGLLHSSLGYPTNQDLVFSHKGLYLLLHSCLFILSKACKCIQVWLIFVFYSLPPSPLPLHPLFLLAGLTCTHDPQHNHKNDPVNVGDEWSMEVDLRSREKRTLHWFVNGKQQKGFIKGVPDRVEFGVCCSVSLLLFHICICSLISVQLAMLSLNESIEFVRLEETETPSVREIEGEVGMEW